MYINDKKLKNVEFDAKDLEYYELLSKQFPTDRKSVV